MRRLLVLAVLLVAVVVTASGLPRAAAAPSSSAPKVRYKPPVDAPITDHFRKPEKKWNAGNRGIEYATPPGTPVRAAADGEVTFADQVGGTLHVVVLHVDGLRTSYSFLQTVTVHRGDHVKQGDVVGTSGPSLHFGARQPDDTYIDPETLFDGADDVHLVPDPDPNQKGETRERNAIVKLLANLGRGTAGATASGVGWAARQAAPVASAAVSVAVPSINARFDQLRGMVHYAVALQPCIEVMHVAAGVAAWNEQRRHCTPADVAPPKLATRHRLVLVGGLGSSSGNAAVLDVPAARLGYAPSDVAQFSYRGGTTRESPYGPADTQADLRSPGRGLRELLDRMARDDPAVPVDVIAHSQGGLVTRAALGNEVDYGDLHLPVLGAVITLGSPHSGADLATAVSMVSHAPAGRAALTAVGAASGAPDPMSPAVHELSETSGFVRGMKRRPIPPGVHFTSIGARGDLIVPAPRTHLAGASNVTVSVPGAVHDHDRLPGSAAAEREMALAIAGMPPTCQGFTDAMADTVVGDHVSRIEDAFGAGLWASAHAASPLPFTGAS